MKTMKEQYLIGKRKMFFRVRRALYSGLAFALLFVAMWASTQTVRAEQIEIQICAPNQLASTILILNQNNAPNIMDTIVMPASCILDFQDPFEDDIALPKIVGNLTIEGNGSTIQRNADANPMQLLYVDAGVTKLSLRNLTMRGGEARANGAAIHIASSNADVSMEAVELRDNLGFHGGALYSKSAVPLKIANSLFENNLADFGGAIYAPNVELRSSGFTNNEAIVDGGALYVSERLSVLLQTDFSNNISGDDGGAIYAAKTISTLDASFNANIAVAAGGSIYQADPNQFVGISRTSFRQNEAGRGGALYVAGIASIIECEFEENSAVSAAGALYAKNNATLRASYFKNNRTVGQIAQGGGAVFFGNTVTLEETIFDGNHADGLGGGLYAGDTVEILRITDGQFTRNSSGTIGGGVLSEAKETTINNVSFIDNSSSFGGGLYVRRSQSASGTLTISGSLFSKNHAVSSGGALGISDSVPTTVTESEFTGNAMKQAQSGAGAAISSNSPLTIQRSSFSDNGHARVGGAIYARAKVDISRSYFGNNVASEGGGALFQIVYPDAEAQSALVNNIWDKNQTDEAGSALWINLDPPPLLSAAKQESLTNPAAANATNAANHLAIVHNTIINGITPNSSAIYVQSGQVDVVNSIIAAHGIGIENEEGSVTSRYNLFSDNDQDVAGNVLQENDISSAPLFESLEFFTLGPDSPAINSGTDAGVIDDYNGNARPHGAGFDRGAHEYLGDDPVATPEAPTATPEAPTTTPEAPTATPEPSVTVMPPTNTPQPTGEASPTATAAPTEEPTAGPTVVQPTSTAIPTEVPSETGTPLPTQTATEMPTEMPTNPPTATPVPDVPITGLSASNSSPALPGNAIRFAAFVTDGNNIQYMWDFGDGTGGSGASTSHAYSQPGLYTARVTASNGISESSAETTVTVNPTPEVDNPITNLVATVNGEMMVSKAIDFIASVEGGSNIVYTWTFGDGGSTSGAVASYTYSEPGIYNVRVLASNSVSSVESTTTVIVERLPENPPGGTGDPVQSIFLPLIHR